MFLPNSRYYGLPTVSAKARAGHEVAAVRLRTLPATTGEPLVVKAHDQLDVVSETRYGDAPRYWHLADANTELEANALVREPGRTINVPTR